MKFEVLTTGTIRIPKRNHVVTKEIEIYVADGLPYFGIAIHPIKFENWCLIHMISEQSIASCFKSKEDVEDYVDYLARYTDLNCILLCTPEFSFIEREIKTKVELSYMKYRATTL